MARDRGTEARRWRRRCAAGGGAEELRREGRETGERQLLNFGHTFGHALETETGFGDALLHGEAVALGMRLAFDLSAQLGLCPKEAPQRVRRHYTAVGLPIALSQIANARGFAPVDLLRHMGKDKKV